jgi:hypothetical protein
LFKHATIKVQVFAEVLDAPFEVMGGLGFDLKEIDFYDLRKKLPWCKRLESGGHWAWFSKEKNLMEKQNFV